MFKLPKTPMTEVEVQPTWEYLISRERLLKRNVLVSRIIQPLGAVLFVFNMLLVSMNFGLFYFGEKMSKYFEKLPLLPTLVESMPRDGWTKVILFSILIGFIVPLLICGMVAGGFYLRDWLRYRDVQVPLNGTQAQKAQALTNLAENVYELRRKILHWTIYLESGMLTGLMAVVIVFMFIDYASGGAIALQLALVALLLLTVLFGLFWFYALLAFLFSRLNALYYLSPSDWKLYELYHRTDAYWESVDPEEFAKRQAAAKK